MKTRNLTQISLRNDPINRRMHGFSFRVSKEKNWSSRCEFFFLFQSNFDFKHSVYAEMHQEHRESNDTWNDGLYKSNLTKIHGPFFPSRRTEFREVRSGRDRLSDGLIAINGRDETSFHESTSLFDDRWIADGGSRCDLIAWRRRCFDFDRPLDFDPTLVMSREIHRSRAISAVITREINGWDVGSLKWRIEHVRDPWSHGPRFHVIYGRYSTRFRSNALRCATRPKIKEIEG